MTFLILFSIFAQQPDEIIFRTSVAQVRVDVQVVENNRPVTGLTKEDFVIYDEGTLRPITYFGHEAEPVTVLLLMDVSGSMKRYLEQVARTAKQALNQLHPQDRAGVMAFSRGTQLFHPFSNRFNEAAREIEVAVLDAKMPAGTAIYASLIEAAGVFLQDRNKSGRRAILMLTDGAGLNYLANEEQTVRALGAADVVMNAVVVGKERSARAIAGGNPDFTPSDVFRVASRTGGEAVRAERADQAFAEMIGRLRDRYSLAFTVDGEPKAGEYRRLRVELTGKARERYRKAEVRARSGYGG